MELKAAKELLHIQAWLARVDEIARRGRGAYLADDLLQEAGDLLMMKLGEAANRMSQLGVLAPDGGAGARGAGAAGSAALAGRGRKLDADWVCAPSGQRLDADGAAAAAHQDHRLRGCVVRQERWSSWLSSASSSPPAICRVSSSRPTSDRFLSSTAWPSLRMMKWLPTR